MTTKPATTKPATTTPATNTAPLAAIAIRAAAIVAAIVAAMVTAAACGGAPAAVEGAAPTPTAIRATLGGSPLDAIDNDPANDAANDADSDVEGDLVSASDGVDAIGAADLDPDAVDCHTLAEDPQTECNRPAVDGLDAIRFDDTLWSYTQDGFAVYTNVTEPYPIQDVVAATVAVARAELAGQNQALFAHLSNRRSTPPYVDIGVWSVTFLFAPDPVADPAQVKVAIEGTTATGETVDELITYLWQWTPDRWIPEWEPATPTTGTGDSTRGTGDSTRGTGDSSEGGSDSISGLAEPPSGGSWCPPGFPYAHKNGKCYANPIRPTDQVGGPPVTEPPVVLPGAPYVTAPDE